VVYLVAKKVLKKSKKSVAIKINSSKNTNLVIGPIKRNDLLGDIISKYPEITPVLAQSGLHCIGCHVSVSESLEDGCSVHGMNDKEINELVNNANKKISDFEKMPKVTFTKNAVLELIKRKESSNKKYVRIVNSYGGEFDFDTTNEMDSNDVLVAATNAGVIIEVLLFSPIERMLRGIEIDYDSKLKDFIAKRK
jgi:hybrid cluster-associated redox disulfide protein